MLTLKKISEDIMNIAEYYSNFYEDGHAILSKYFLSTNTGELFLDKNSRSLANSVEAVKPKEISFGSLANPIAPQKINLEISLPKSSYKIIFKEDSLSLFIKDNGAEISIDDQNLSPEIVKNIIDGLHIILKELETASSWQKYSKLDKAPKSNDYSETNTQGLIEKLTAENLIAKTKADEAAKALAATKEKARQEKMIKIERNLKTYEEKLISINNIEAFQGRIEEFKAIFSILCEIKSLTPLFSKSETAEFSKHLKQLGDNIAKPDYFSQFDAITSAEAIEKLFANNSSVIEIALERGFSKRDYQPYLKKIADDFRKERFAGLRNATASPAQQKPEKQRGGSKY